LPENVLDYACWVNFSNSVPIAKKKIKIKLPIRHIASWPVLEKTLACSEQFANRTISQIGPFPTKLHKLKTWYSQAIRKALTVWLHHIKHPFYQLINVRITIFVVAWNTCHHMHCTIWGYFHLKYCIFVIH